MSYADRVRAGVALLDEKVPGWHRYMDLGALELYSCDRCVLGQLFGSFAVGADSLFGPERDTHSADHGFDITEEAYERDEQGISYKTLNRLWFYVIRARQAESAEIDRDAQPYLDLRPERQSGDLT